MNTITSIYRRTLPLLMKCFYLLILLICVGATIRNFYQTKFNITISLFVITIKLIIYSVILLFPVFLRLYLQPYEDIKGIGIVKLSFLICAAVILWFWYPAMFCISLCLIYTVLLRKNTPISLISASLVSILCVYFSADCASLIVLAAFPILLHSFKLRQLIFLFINTFLLGVYSLLTYNLIEVPTPLPYTVLIAIILAYVTVLLYSKYQNTTQTMIRLFSVILSVFNLFLVVFLPNSFPYIWYIAPLVLTGHLVRSASNSPSLEEIMHTHQKSFFTLLFMICLPIIAAILIFAFTINNGNLTDRALSYPLLQYYVTWSDLGFVQRGLVGEIVKILFGSVIPLENMIVIGLVIHFISAIMLIILFANIYQMADKSSITPDLSLYIFIGTIMLSYLYSFVFRSDLLLAIIALLCVILCIKNTASVLFIPFLSIIAMLIHPAYGFMIFAPVFIAMCYRAFIHPEKHLARNTLILISTTLSVIVLFVFFSFFSYRFAKLGVYDAVQLMLSRTAGYIDNDPWLYYVPELDANPFFSSVLFADYQTHFSYMFVTEEMIQLSHSESLKRSVTLLPLLLYFFYVYFKASKQYENHLKRIICCLLPFTIIVLAPLYIWEVDFGRWNIHLILTIVIAIQFPAIMEQTSGKPAIKEKTLATYTFILSEFASIITWYA